MSDTSVPPPAGAWGAPPSGPAPARRLPRALFGRLPLKTAGMALLALVYALPLALIADLVGDRSRLLERTREEITGSWGGMQTLVGPLLLMPHDSARGKDEAVLLPDQLDIEAALAPQVRYRGMFEAVVYTLDATMRGRFRLAPGGAGTPTGLRWERLKLRLSAGDLRGLRLDTVMIDGRPVAFEPSAQGENTIDADIGAIDPTRLAEGVPFEIRLRLNGSERIGFVPAGTQTDIKLAAPWPDPGFYGRFRPVAQRIGEGQFDAHWQVSILSRGFGAIATSADDSRDKLLQRLGEAAFGVQLVQPVTPYRGVDRMLKYGLLIVGCTFALYLAFEIAGRIIIHPIQYALSGAAMALFPLLLLAVGEHLGFTPAYAAAAVVVVIQTALYTWHATLRPVLAALFGGAIAALFAYLYLLLQAESWSLLGGSLALFAILSGLMYATRNIGRRESAVP
ncbi:cell envelope integrity protein CreD [Vineibacter terrae]|uniref:cell envelope integrity protein CreD n=1 Tax=Vineibacter terrae TaxID=2586908 RepID=UPI002E34C0C3|nr:cell envelope integrity protein CreD [Vineibacter terrae]HEX2891620.1 cell envelope integrity protein CreD [Vineibacter terrae]